MSYFVKLDPAIFGPHAVDPETAAFNEKLESLLSMMPSYHTMTPQEVREERESGNSV